MFSVGVKTDKEIIDSLGGPAKVARLLGLTGRPGQVQRVHNWKSRGIPVQVRLDHPGVFPVSAKKSQITHGLSEANGAA